MALSSMTGFARAEGVSGAYVWAWELKSVNAKGLELRLRLPPGWDAVEAPARARNGASTASHPGGRRSRSSRPLALTDFSSQAQTYAPDTPSARAKPVMLDSAIRRIPRSGARRT